MLWLCVCSSVCLSQAGILSNRLNTPSHKQTRHATSKYFKQPRRRDSEASMVKARGSKGRGGWGSWGGGGQPPPHELADLGERCRLPQWGPGPSPGRKRFWRISKPVEYISWKQFLSQEQPWQLCSSDKNCFQEMSSTGLEMRVLV